jgi:serine/threonine-protein kinase
MAETSTRDEAMPLPERVGRYDVLLPIAAGGMATVYLARARGVGGFERDVALKLTHAHLRASPEFASDLVDEAKLASRIRHPNVVQVLEVGEDPLGIYLLMDYIEGDSLAGLVRRAKAAGALSLPVFVRVLSDALAGLHAAHDLRDEDGRQLDIVHRDFSPQNVLVGVDGMARLADFGIARASTRVSHTRTGAVKGKICYMSPEQAKGEPLDRRSDVWAAGVVAWEIFAGRRLYSTGDNDVATMLKIVTQTPPPLRSVRPDTPAEIEEAVASALTLDVAARCPTARDFAQRLLAAARRTCGVAEIAEVAEYVERLAGPKLAERRRKIAEVGKLRAEMERVVESRDAGARTPTSSQVAMVHVAPEPPGDGETVTRARPDGAAMTSSDALTGTDTVSVSGPRRVTARPPLGSTWALVVTGAICLAGGVALALWILPGTTPERGRVESAPATRASIVSATHQEAPPTASATTARTLRIVANAPVASVRLGGRTLPLERAAATVTVAVPAELVGEVRLRVTANDGRMSSEVLTLGAGETEIEVSFAAPSSQVVGTKMRRVYGKKR